MKWRSKSRFSHHDMAIWHTIDAVRHLENGTLEERPRVLTPFAPQLSAAEFAIAQGPFRLYAHGSAGDGTYLHDSGVFFSTGRGGLALTAGFAAARARRNSRRRAAAAAAAQPRWLPIDQGILWVCDLGFYLDTPTGLHTWAWQFVRAASMQAPGAVHIQGDSANGPITWILQSDWAELVFVLWARTIHPRHPQWITSGWVPDGWRARLESSEYVFPPRQT